MRLLSHAFYPFVAVGLALGAQQKVAFLRFRTPLNAVRRWFNAIKPVTRANQSWQGGLRIEPGGTVKGMSLGDSRPLSLFNALRRHGSGKQAKAELLFWYGRAPLCSNIHQKAIY